MVEELNVPRGLAYLECAPAQATYTWRYASLYPLDMTTRIGDALVKKLESVWPDILGAFEAGEQVDNVLREHGLKRNQIYAYFRIKPEKRQEWEDAREQSADALFDEALQVARNPTKERISASGSSIPPPPDAQYARTLVDTLKWAARIRNPRLYGDKAQLDVNVKTVDLTRIVADANARLAQARHRTLGQDVSDAVVVRHALGVASNPDSSQAD